MALIKNKEHLKQIIKEYGKNIFIISDISKNPSISDDILNFINQIFIDNVFFYNGSIVGANVDSSDIKIKEIQYKQRSALIIFLHLFLKNYYVPDDSSFDSREYTEISSGSKKFKLLKYNPMEETYYVGMYTKLISLNTDMSSSHSMTRSDYNDVPLMKIHTKKNFEWFTEFCTYVIIISILKYIDCTLIIDDTKRTECFISKYKNEFEKDGSLSGRSLSGRSNDTFNTMVSTQSTPKPLTSKPLTPKPLTSKPLSSKPIGSKSIISPRTTGSIKSSLGSTSTASTSAISLEFDRQSMYESTEKCDYFLSYFSFMAILKTPFIKITEKSEYIIGYEIENTNTTISKLYDSLNMTMIKPSETFYDAFNLTYQILEILEKLSHLNNLGIILSHRNITGDNIIYFKNEIQNNKYKINLIDFGFLCSNIMFENGESIIIGYHPYESEYKLNLCNKPSHDVLLFIAWCLKYKNQLFKLIKEYTRDDKRGIKGFDVYTELYNIINGSFVDEAIFRKIGSDNINRLGKQFDVQDYASIINIDSDRYIMIINQIFTTMKESKRLLEDKYGLDNFENIDYGNIRLFNIGDKKKSGELSQYYDKIKYIRTKHDYLTLGESKDSESKEESKEE
jgi:hypothetical protein